MENTTKCMENGARSKESEQKSKASGIIQVNTARGDFDMKKCEACGHSNRYDSIYCSKCGEKLQDNNSVVPELKIAGAVLAAGLTMFFINSVKK